MGRDASWPIIYSTSVERLNVMLPWECVVFNGTQSFHFIGTQSFPFCKALCITITIQPNAATTTWGMRRHGFSNLSTKPPPPHTIDRCSSTRAWCSWQSSPAPHPAPHCSSCVSWQTLSESSSSLPLRPSPAPPLWNACSLSLSLFLSLCLSLSLSLSVCLSLSCSIVYHLKPASGSTHRDLELPKSQLSKQSIQVTTSRAQHSLDSSILPASTTRREPCNAQPTPRRSPSMTSASGPSNICIVVGQLASQILEVGKCVGGYYKHT